MVRRSLWAQWALIGTLTLSGCGEADTGPKPLTDVQKEQQASATKATEDAFKDAQKTKKAKGATPKGGRTVNGVPTS